MRPSLNKRQDFRIEIKEDRKYKRLKYAYDATKLLFGENEANNALRKYISNS